MKNTKPPHKSNQSTKELSSKKPDKSFSDTSSTAEKLEVRIAESIAKLLTEIIEDNESISEPNKELKINIGVFTYKKPPSISIDAYMSRIQKYSKLEYPTLILSLIYLDRVCELNEITMTKYNIHSILVAIKYNEDDYYSNSFYSRVGGITLQELNTVEAEFVRLSNFNLFVNYAAYEKYKTYLMAYQE